jgi:hypothetical protein
LSILASMGATGALHDKGVTEPVTAHNQEGVRSLPPA